jgi:AraC-like DNA-binding protein
MQIDKIILKEKAIFSNDETLKELYTTTCSSVSIVALNSNNPHYYSTLEEANSYEIIYITEGECECELTNNPKTILKKGDFLLLRAGLTIKLTCDTNHNTLFYNIKISGIQYTFFIKQIKILQNSTIFSIGTNVAINGIIQNMIQILNENKNGSQALLSTSTFHILGIVNYKVLNYNEREAPILAKINTAKEIICNDIEAKISPEEIANQLKISYSLFRCEFRKFVGISPSQFQMDIRLQRAQELLTTTNQSISHIANTLGFTDTAQFSTFFRKRQNITPRDYRKKNR